MGKYWCKKEVKFNKYIGTIPDTIIANVKQVTNSYTKKKRIIVLEQITIWFTVQK